MSVGELEINSVKFEFEMLQGALYAIVLDKRKLKSSS